MEVNDIDAVIAVWY